jgi:hypothetical protein
MDRRPRHELPLPRFRPEAHCHGFREVIENAKRVIRKVATERDDK